MKAPLPRERLHYDTQFPTPTETGEPVAIDVRDPRNRYFGHIDGESMDPTLQTQDRLALSASMRTALLVYSGISVKMMIDSDLGADLSTMFMVQYEPGGFAGAHDHPLEEAYLILEGEVEAKFDGATYHLERGDVAWAGVGCVHEFKHLGDGPVRWLETQAPQPPPRHSYRFARDWMYLDTPWTRPTGHLRRDLRESESNERVSCGHQPVPGSDGCRLGEPGRLRGLAPVPAGRVRRMLEEFDLGAVLLFETSNIRYATATQIGYWAFNKGSAGPW
jgi:quercetin dioxygenase-like cupin family protein